MQHHLTRHALRLARLAFPLICAGVCFSLLTARIDMAALAAVPGHLAQLPGLSLPLAAIFSLISLWAVGRYDGVAHRHLETGVDVTAARRTGTISIALSQTLGFGLFTGAVARWRMLPDLAFRDALRLSSFVCLSFLASWACVTALACLILPAPGWTTAPAWGALICLPVLLAGFVAHPRIKCGRFRLRAPSLVACGAIALWTCLDLGAAALAFYLVIPGDTLSFAALLPAFLIALGAGLLSGTPGGVGPFEVVLIALLPQVPVAHLLAGIVGFRLIYYALPATLAMAALIRPFGARRARRVATRPNWHAATRAEIGVIRQNGGSLIALDTGGIAVWPTAQTLTALGDPFGTAPAVALNALAHHAAGRNRIPCLYKCTARTARAARARGWSVLRYADEAVLKPAVFDLAVPACRTLRRKLRQAQTAGVSTTAATHLPLADMAMIDADWQDRNGPARGGSMGRFAPDYVANQRVFLAHLHGRPVAFVSFHHTDNQWCLDLIRTRADAPDGTVHALIVDALRAAARAGIAELSLAATPACADPSSAVMRALARQIVQRSGGPGLRQFKSSFAPRWQPLYVAAPNRGSLAAALADIAREVHHPPALPACRQPHNQDEDNEVALLLAS